LRISVKRPTSTYLPFVCSAGDTVYINATLLKDKSLALNGISLLIRSISIDCPTVEFQPFSLTFNRNVSIVNITSTGFCFLSWSASASNYFNVSDSWVSAGFRFSASSGSFSVGRYFKISNFGATLSGAKVTIPSLVASRSLHRSLVSIGQFGVSLVSAASSWEWYNVDIRKAGTSSSYIDMPRGNVLIQDATINNVYISVGETTNSTLTLTNTSTTSPLYVKAPATAGNTGSLVINGNFRSTNMILMHRGLSRLQVNGNATVSQFGFYMESPTKNYTEASEVSVAQGASFSFANTGSQADNLFGYNTRYLVNGTLQIGSGSATVAAGPLYANVTDSWASIVFACLDNAAQIITDPISLGSQAYVLGCKFGTVASPASQNFPIVSLIQGSQLVLDASVPTAATHFAANTTITGTLGVNAVSAVTPRKVLSVSGQTFSFAGDIIVSPADSVAIGETLALISIANTTTATVTLNSVTPSGWELVSNSSFVGLYRPVPPPEAPPVDAPVDPPANPPFDAPINPPTSGGNAPNSGGGNAPNGVVNAPTSNGNAPGATGNAPSGSIQAPVSAKAPSNSAGRVIVEYVACMFALFVALLC
jgi:hypothetical protein